MEAVATGACDEHKFEEKTADLQTEPYLCLYPFKRLLEENGWIEEQWHSNNTYYCDGTYKKEGVGIVRVFYSPDPFYICVSKAETYEYDSDPSCGGISDEEGWCSGNDTEEEEEIEFRLSL
jgi:hypothetical protein